MNLPKIPKRPLLVSAALLFAAFAAPCFAASDSATITITSGTIASGLNLSYSSGTVTIKPAKVYSYSITGTCDATNYFSFIIKNGDSLATVLGIADSALVPYLQGIVLNPSGKLPFVCANVLATGSNSVDGLDFGATVRAKAGITSTGVFYADLTNLLFTLDKATIPLKDGYLVITKGKATISVLPFSGPAKPNLGFILGSNSHVPGLGLTGTSAVGHSHDITLDKGKAATSVIALWNAGSAAGRFILKSPAIGSGFTESFIYGGVDKTAEVNSAGGFSIPATGTLAGGDVVTVSWKITNVSAAKGAKINPVLTATLATSPTVKDEVVISATGG